MSLSVSPNESPLKFSSPDKISNLKSPFPGQHKKYLSSQYISLKSFKNSVQIPNSPEEIISLFNKKEVLISKLLEDNKSLSSFIQQNDLNKIRQDKEKLEQDFFQKEEENQKLKLLLEAHIKKQQFPDQDLKNSGQKSPETLFFEIPENKLIEELMEKQIKEFKSKIKEMASEIEKEKHKNEDFEAEIKRNSQVIKNNEEKIVLLSTELQRTMNILGFLQTENLSLKENERIYKENERSLISIKTGLEERLKSLCLELEKRENERNFKNTDDEKNFKTAINNALRLLKEEEEKFQVFFEKLQAKDEKIRVLEDKTQFLRNKKGLNEALEVQKSQFKAKFEEISRLYEDSLIRLRGKDEKLNLQEKIIEQIKKNNQENDKKLRSPENKEHDILLKENERLQRLLIDQGNKSIENHKFLLNVEAENLRKLIIDHYNGYLVIVRNNDLQAGLKAEAPISELREKLNSIIKAFNKIIIDYMSSQIVFTETLKEKKASEELLAQKTLEIKEFEAKNQELLAKNLLINAEIMRLSQILKQIEGDFIEKGHEFESKLLLAQTEIENIKSSLKFRNQENESLKKSNEHLMRYSSFESEFLALKRELENSEMKYIEKLKENEVLKRKFIENSDLLSQKTETVKKAVSDKENFKINELEIELKFSKQEIEHLAKIKQEQIVQIGELKAALLELENEKTGFKLNKEESKAKIAILEEEKEKFLNEFIAKNTFDGQISQFKAKIDKLEHEKSLKEYENESLRSSLKGKEKLEEEIERIKEKNVELERELAFYKKKLLEYEDIKKEYEILLEKIEMFEAKNKQISRELQESNEQKKRFEGEIQRKTEEIEGIKGFEVKYRDLFNRQALSVSEIERLHQIIREKNEDNKRFNIEIRDLQKENDQNRENLRNYNELKVIIESLKGENEEINVNMFKLKEENLRNNEKIAKLEEENWAMREKNREIEGFNKENLKKLLEYQKFLEKLEFENEKLKSLMFERLKEIEALKRKISEISNVFEENANSAKEKFEDIVTNFLKEEKNQTFLDRNRNLLENRNLAEEGLKFNGKAEKTEKTEKKVAKKRTKSYLFENENDLFIKFEDDLASQLGLYENILKMISFELTNLSQFKEGRINEIKRIKEKLAKIKQTLEKNAFLLEERNLKFQDLLLQACTIEKKVEKVVLEEKISILA